MIITIPKSPAETHLTVERQWDGSACPDPLVHAEVALAQTSEGVRVRVRAPVLPDARIPAEASVMRVANLWEYDVVEVFFVGPGHHYLELELGAGGHWLLLSFDEVRHRSNEHEKLSLKVDWKREGSFWTSEVTIPRELIPEPLRALNAFVIARGFFLAMSPVSGTEADFHQPDKYPKAEFE